MKRPHADRADKKDSVLDELHKPKEAEEKEAGPAGFEMKTAVVAIALIIIGFGLLIFFASIVEQPSEKTLDELHADNLAGNGAEGDYVYNGYSFVKYAGLWHSQVADGNRLYDLKLHFGPQELQDIGFSGEGLNDSFFNDSELFITFEPKENNLTYVSLAAAELSLSLSTAINRFPTAACTKNETEVCTQRPIVTCESTSRAVLSLEEREPAGITFEGNCIRVHGVGWDLVKSANRLLYQWYGIMRMN